MSEMADEAALEQADGAAVEEAQAEAEVEAPAAPAEPSLDPTEVQAELEYLRSQNTQMQSAIEQWAQQQQGQQTQQGQQGPDIFSQLVDEYGQFNPQAFAQIQAANNQLVLNQIREMFNPIQENFQNQQEQSVIAEGEQRLADILADDVARNGEFASDPEADARAREFVAERASQIFPEFAEKWGPNPRTAQMAMERAAQEVRGLLQSVGGAAVQQNQNQLATLAGAQGEIGGTAAGVEAPVIRLGETSASRFATNPNG